MSQSTTVVGLDVHKDSIVASILPSDAHRASKPISFENRPAALRRFIERLGRRGPRVFVYEAGPCGYAIHRELVAQDESVVIVAPALIPVRPGDRVKTDRRDAERLARLYRAGELTPIRIPTRAEEAARDLVRIREDILVDRLRARHRLSKFLLRHGRVYQVTKTWGKDHRRWLYAQHFDLAPWEQTYTMSLRALEETEARLAIVTQHIEDLAHTAPYRPLVQALRCLKGIDTLSAFTLVVETQDFGRFPHAPAYMSATGLVSSEYSSGAREHRGSITKTGNAHLRRVLVEAAWTYRGPNRISPVLAKRRSGCPTAVIQIAQRAQDRLHRKFWRLVSRGKPSQVAVVAVARELAGFVWAIAQHVPIAHPA
jgi:transposase